MGALFSRVKTWVSTENVTYSDLNAEFDNILNNLTIANVDDYSANTSQMQTTTDPGEVGTESLATSGAGEIARLRHLIREITGEDEWYETPVSSILGLANSIGTGLTANRIVSGKVRSTSSQPVFLDPDGSARTVYARGTSTNLVYYVNGTEYTISTDVSLTSLTAAPSSNNTCLINDTNASDQYWTKYAGEDGGEIPVDNMGSEISALVGKFAAFKLANGSADEYFIAHVTSTTSLTKARRGYFFDSSDAPIPRVVYANNDTITLMKLTWIFAKTDGTLTATYTNPVWSKDEPSSPAIGDYWFDLDNNTWKVYGVGAYASAGATLIGICIQDTTNTVAARSFEPFKNFAVDNTVELFAESNSQVKSRHQGSVLNVWGETIKCDYNLHTWDMSLDLETGVTEAASTYYYFYLTQDGEVKISDVKPHDRREDLGGFYHTHNSWRCVGFAYNDGSSNLGNVESYYSRYPEMEVTPVETVTSNIEVIPRIIRVSGASGAYSKYLPPAASVRGQEFIITRTDNTTANAVTLDGFGSETINGSTTYVLALQYQSIKIFSDGSNWILIDEYIPPVVARVSGNPGNATTTNPIIFPTTDFDTHLAYGTATGLYTCPIAGYYLVSGLVATPTAGINIHLYKNSSSDKLAGFGETDGGDAIISIVANCAIGDTLSLRPVGSSIDCDSTCYVNFQRIR